MLVDLIDTPYIILMILFVLRVDCVQFADCRRRCKQGRVEKPREAFKGSRESRGCNVEVIIGICGGGEGVRGAVISGKELRDCQSG